MLLCRTSLVSWASRPGPFKENCFTLYSRLFFLSLSFLFSFCCTNCSFLSQSTGSLGYGHPLLRALRWLWHRSSEWGLHHSHARTQRMGMISVWGGAARLSEKVFLYLKWVFQWLINILTLLILNPSWLKEFFLQLYSLLHVINNEIYQQGISSYN